MQVLIQGRKEEGIITHATMLLLLQINSDSITCVDVGPSDMVSQSMYKPRLPFCMSCSYRGKTTANNSLQLQVHV